MLPPGFRHPLHLGNHLFGIRDHGYHKGGDGMVEAVVLERHVFRVHFDQVYVVQLVLLFFSRAFSSIFLVTSMPTT